MNIATTGQMARIFLKDGNRQVGLLLNDVDREDAFDEGVKFIPHHKTGEWLESFSTDHIEVLSAESVDGIDLFMK